MATRVSVWPTSIERDCLFKLTERVTGSLEEVTLKRHFAEYWPILATMSVSPGPKTLTVTLFPLGVTVATLGTVLFQLTVTFAVDGLTSTEAIKPNELLSLPS